jgi:callose synthase
MIFVEVEKHITEDKVITELKLHALPDLYNKFVELVKYLVCVAYVLLLKKPS